MATAVDLWEAAGQTINLMAATGAVLAAVWIGRRCRRFGLSGKPIVAGLLLSALWCMTSAASGSDSLIAGVAEGVQNLVWLFAVYRLFSSDGRHNSVAPIRPVAIVLAVIIAIHLCFQLLAWGMTAKLGANSSLFNFAVMIRSLVAVGGLLLVHNLYIGASSQARLALRWPAAALGILWAFDLNFYTIAYLGGDWPHELGAARGLSVMALSVLLVIGASRSSEALKLRPSRSVTFQTASLLVIAGYFIAMFAVAQWLAFTGGGFARWMEVAVLMVGSVLALVLLPSPRMRSWLRVTLTKHFFQHRYDYRAEWLRFTRTIGNSGDESLPLEERVVQAVADIAESPAGLLLAPDESGELVLAARWQWSTAEVPATAMGADAIAFFEQNGYIVDLDELRKGHSQRGEAAIVPAWLLEEGRAWALVPLIHYDRLTGIVVLARGLQTRRFDWEDFDLLRVVGQQIASYLAEHAGQQALAEANRFDDFHRRIAFVMHDIKNLASQLSLLARNAERHADNPAFRDDMLLTLRNSADKLNALLARLSRYRSGTTEQMGPVSGAEVARAVARRFQGQHPVVLAEIQDCTLTANRDSLEQLLVHIVQNGVDASTANAPVFIALTSDGLHGRYEIIDSGCGMSPDFVRSKLFKPFVSSKSGGFGIGAYEARELVRAMQGRLDVESREGLGSRFVVRMPLATTSSYIKACEPDGQKVA